MSSLLVVLSAVLIGVIFALLFRVQSLLSVLTGSDNKKDSSYNKVNAILFPVFLVVGLGLFFWATFSLDYQLPEAASVHGKRTDDLTNVTLYVITAVFILTNALLLIFPYIYKYDKKRKVKFFAHDTKLEVIWTVIPAIVLTFLVLKGNSVWWDMMSEPEGENKSKHTVVLEVLAERFQWNFRYPGQDFKLGKHNYRKIDGTNIFGTDFTDRSSLDDFTTQEIVIPKGADVMLKIRAKDVLHSVFLPHFRVKMDAVPGMPTSFWFKPTISTYEMRKKLNNPDFEYELACTEICGNAHFNMRRVVTVLEQEEYDEWYASQKPWVVNNPSYAASKLTDKDDLISLRKVLEPYKSKEELEKLSLPMGNGKTNKVASL